jgi:hypothetical protein
MKAKQGKTQAAIQDLAAMQASAHKFGYGLYEFQARLAIGEIEMTSGSAAANGHLNALANEAAAQGAGLIANQAQMLLTDKKAN